MKKNAFTLIEILFVLIIIGSLSSWGVNSFRRARNDHRIDSLLQELTVLRTAILSYKEMYGSLPIVEESALSSDSFNALRHFWYPFRPENSKIFEGGSWWGKLGANAENTFLAVKKDCQYFHFEVDVLKSKNTGFCCFDDTGTYFYILK